jgi:hypothetical protein
MTIRPIVAIVQSPLTTHQAAARQGRGEATCEVVRDEAEIKSRIFISSKEIEPVLICNPTCALVAGKWTMTYGDLHIGLGFYLGWTLGGRTRRALTAPLLMHFHVRSPYWLL